MCTFGCAVIIMSVWPSIVSRLERHRSRSGQRYSHYHALHKPLHGSVAGTGHSSERHKHMCIVHLKNSSNSMQCILRTKKLQFCPHGRCTHVPVPEPPACACHFLEGLRMLSCLPAVTAAAELLRALRITESFSNMTRKLKVQVDA